jgi:hypothetical protein
MSTQPRPAEGQDALVTASPDAEPLTFVVASVQGDRVTLSAKDGATGLRAGATAHLQYVDRFGVYDVDAPVLSVDGTGVVMGVPSGGDESTIRRRAYVRLRAPLDATCLLLDPQRNEFAPLGATVVDIGGGGAALAVAAIAPTGGTMVCSIALPGAPAPVVTVGTVLPADADPRDHAERRHVRLQFTLITESDRDRILAFALDALRTRAG